MSELVVQKKGEPSWVRYIRQRIRQDKNFLALISGPTGSGKSFSCLGIAEMLDPNFGVDQVVFSGVDVMKLINSGSLSKGSVIVWEEVGVSLSSKTWQSPINRMLAFLLMTFRHKNLVMLMNSQLADFLDASARKLLHAEFKTGGIDFKKQEVCLIPKYYQYNDGNRVTYKKYLRVATGEGVVPVVSWSVPKPKSQELIDAYLLKKDAFTAKLNADILFELEQAEGRKANSAAQPSAAQTLTSIQQDTLSMLERGMTVPQIAQERGRAERVVEACMQGLKRKGYAFKPVYEQGRLARYDVSAPKVRSDIGDVVLPHARV